MAMGQWSSANGIPANKGNLRPSGYINTLRQSTRALQGVCRV